MLHGDGGFLFKEFVAVVISGAWAFAFTYGTLWLIDRITPVHVGSEMEEEGLDAGLHGENAYSK